MSTAQKLDVLVLEDDPADWLLLEHQLKRWSGAGASFERSTSLEDALKRLEVSTPDVAIVDLYLPDSRGLQTVDRLRDLAPRLPIVILSSLDDESLAVDSVRKGAQDYLVKGKINANLLGKSLHYAIERQRLYDELEESKRTEAEIKDRFLSHVSHELRTPLNALYQFVAILLDGVAGEMTEQQTDYVRIIQRNSQQLERMISDLMDVTRLTSDKLVLSPEVVDLAPLLEESVATLDVTAKSKGIELELEITETLPEVVVDPERARQVVLNLVGNAIKFTPEGGRITVSTETSSDAVRVHVDDTGPGIPEQDAERLFDRLWQEEDDRIESRKGLGLGLYISREIVVRHGGSLSAERRPEGGSRFSFTLPTNSLLGALKKPWRARSTAHSASCRLPSHPRRALRGIASLGSDVRSAASSPQPAEKATPWCP